MENKNVQSRSACYCTTADTTGADVVKNALDQANHFEGSAEEAQVAMFLKQLGIKYSKLTKDEFVTLMGILRKSNMLKSPGSKRGKGNRKKRQQQKKQVRTH